MFYTGIQQVNMKKYQLLNWHGDIIHESDSKRNLEDLQAEMAEAQGKHTFFGLHQTMEFFSIETNPEYNNE